MKNYLAIVVAVSVCVCSVWFGVSIGCNPVVGGTDAALEAAPVTTVAPIQENDPGYVAPPSSPPPPRVVKVDAESACLTPTGEWRCKNVARPKTLGATGTQPVTPASWLVTDWFIDPAANVACANDGNTCTSATCTGGCSGTSCQSGQGPCKTFGEVIQHRLGTFSPRLVQPTTFHLLSGQTLNTDFVFFEPYVANGGQAILIGTLITNGASFTPAGLTAKVRGGPGQLLTLTTVPAYVAAKNLIQDTTAHAGQTSYAFVDSIIGGPNAVMEQPIPTNVLSTVGLPTLSEDNAWSATDTYQAYTLPLVNIKSWTPKGGDASGTAVGGGWVQFVQVADSSGTVTSEYPLLSTAGVNALSACQVNSRLQLAITNGRGQGAYCIGCDVLGSTAILAGTAQLYGGDFRAGITIQSGTTPTLDGDVILHGTSFVNNSFVFLTTAYGDNALTVQGAGVVRLGTALWGTTTVTVQPGSTVWNGGGSFTATLLTNGALKFGTLTTGFTSPNCGTFTNNGVTQVDTAPASGHWPAGSIFSWSLNTAGGTPCLAGGPYFSAAVTQDNLFTKAVTANCNDVYNYCALPTSVAINVTNLDLFNGLYDINTGARFSNTN